MDLIETRLAVLDARKCDTFEAGDLFGSLRGVLDEDSKKLNQVYDLVGQSAPWVG
jgi:hypothetical protein